LNHEPVQGSQEQITCRENKGTRNVPGTYQEPLIANAKKWFLARMALSRVMIAQNGLGRNGSFL